MQADGQTDQQAEKHSANSCLVVQKAHSIKLSDLKTRVDCRVPARTEYLHAASGQMAGYLFQPERALSYLAKSPRGTVVGIETLDDVAVIFPDGRRILEQDKHYTSKKKPLADRSKEFWNSLKVWLEAIKSNELDLNLTLFHLVTNRKLEDGLVFDLMNLEANHEAAQEWIRKLRRVGRKPPTKLRQLFKEVLEYSDEQLIALVLRIQVSDSTLAVCGDPLRQSLHDHLHLPPAHAEEIIQGLLGWIDELTLKQIRENRNVWIARDAFVERYNRLLYHYQDIAFIRETAEALIQVKEEEREARKHNLFVKQLEWIGLPEDENDSRILDAIDAHIRAGNEVARLSEKGIVAPAEVTAFEERLLKRWKQLRHLHVRKPISSSYREQEAIGRTLISHTLNHREPLAGQPTTEYYLTEGAYHRLADTPCLGWHPKFEEKIEAMAKSNKELLHAIDDRS